ncbi:MAG: hypothetical protein ACK4VN_04465 [Bacteroidales bacterium]
MNDAVINTGIIVAYALLGIAAVTAIIFPVFQLIVNFKKAKAALIGIGALAVVLFIGFGLSTNEVYEGFAVTSTQSQWIGGGIYATFILAGIALVAAVFTEVWKLIR